MNTTGDAHKGAPKITAEQTADAAAPRRRRLMLWIAIAVVAALVVAGTIVWLVVPRERVASAEWGGGQLTVSAFDVDITIAETPYSEPVATTLSEIAPTDYVALRPVDITADGALPDTGVRLEWTSPVAIPDDVAVTFAWFDEQLGVWIPENTAISADRLTITATVHHLSTWDVMLSGIGDFLSDVGEGIAEGWDRGSKQLFRFTHELLGNAAANPECTEPPSWIKEVLTSDTVDVDYGLGDDGSGIAAVLLCAGSDPNNPDLLQVKAAANRGYGFPVVFADGVQPVSAGISGVDPTLAAVLGAASATFFDGASNLGIDPARFVFATQEYAATFDEANLRDAAESRIVSFELPDALQVLLSATLKLAWEQVGEGDDIVAGILTVMSVVQNCDVAALDDATDLPALTLWLTGCATGFDEDNVAKAADVVASEVFDADNAELAAKVRGNADTFRKVVAKVKFLLLFSVVQQMIDYIGDWVTEDATSYPAWFVQTMLMPPRPTIESLYGQYDRCGVRLAADGIWQSAVGTGQDCGWGDDFRDIQVLHSTTWDGSCYVISMTTTSEMFVGPHAPKTDETWYACPAGFGGPGDDSVDRLGQWWDYGGRVGTWYVRQ